MNVCIFEDGGIHHLHPLVSTRAVYDLRLAQRTLLETICDALGISSPFLHVREELVAVTAEEHPTLSVNLFPRHTGICFINGRYIPSPDDGLVERIQKAAHSSDRGLAFVQGQTVVAAWVPDPSSFPFSPGPLDIDHFSQFIFEEITDATLVNRMWDLINGLPDALKRDCSRYFQGHENALNVEALHARGVAAAHPENIYCAESAEIRVGATLNAENGPIVIDNHASVMEGAVIRGPVYVGPHARVKMGARVKRSAIGEFSKVGGEVSSSIIHSFTNKAHEGYLGHSYLGRWCNIGAGTNISNLKNDYAPVTLYNMYMEGYEQSERQFLGLFMGDHSKCGINTMFNTGTVVGVFCNIFGAGYQDRYIPSFSWGGTGQFVPYRLQKALRVAEAVMNRRDRSLTDAEEELLQHIFEDTYSPEEVFAASSTFLSSGM